MKNINLYNKIAYNEIMIKNNISTIIGMKRLSVSETARIAGLAYNTVDSLYRDETKSIKFETMDRLCYALECTPAELFKYYPNDV